MSGHNGLYFTLLRHDSHGVLEKQSVRVCELPRALLLHFSFAEVQHAVQSLATGKELAPPALRDVNTYCDEAAMLYGQGSRDAAHFLGRALETSAIASAVDLFTEQYAADAADRCSLRQLMMQRGPQVLREVAQWMRAYASALDGHAALVRRVTHNLAALRRARADVYRTLKHVMRERQPRELVRQRRQMLRGAASMPHERPAAAAAAAVRALTLQSALNCPRASARPGPKPCNRPTEGGRGCRAAGARQGSGAAALHGCSGSVLAAGVSAEAPVKACVAAESDCPAAAPLSCCSGGGGGPSFAGGFVGGAETAAQAEPTWAVAECGVVPPQSCFHSASAAHAGARGGNGSAEAAAGLGSGRGKACGAEPGAPEGCSTGVTLCSSSGSVHALRRAVASGRT